MSSVRLFVLTASALIALEARALAEPPNELAYRLEVDGPIALTGGVSWLAAISLRETIGPATCRWCEANATDLAVRRAMLWHDPIAAQKLVDVIGFAVGPAATLSADLIAASHDDAPRQFLADTVIAAEAATIASDVNLAIRFSVARQRPWAWSIAHSPGKTGVQTDRTRDANMSFYSGHATMMFALATSAGTVATMRGYRWAPLVWLVGLSFAVATSYLRVASDDHWMTDVLVGVAAGAATGFAIPYFAHRRVKILPAGSTVSIVGSFD